METATLETKPRFDYTGHGSQGHKYDKDLALADIAKAIRAEFKTEFPGYKFSVRQQWYSGGCSLHVSLMAAPFAAIRDGSSYVQVNQYGFRNEYDDTHDRERERQLTREAWDCMKKVYEISNAYNFDDSDGMIDYFHTNYYLHLNVGGWDKPFIQQAQTKKGG